MVTKARTKSGAARPTAAAKPSAKPPARAAAAKPAAKVAATPHPPPKQSFAVSHYRDDAFAEGVRTYAQYRDLGVAKATHGMVRAHVIRLIGPCDPAKVSKLHFHNVDFQMVYVLKGWIKTEMDGQGTMLMRSGSCWVQPPGFKHLVHDYSGDCELLEVIMPADAETVEL